MVYRQGDFFVAECGCFASDGPPLCAHAGERAGRRGRGSPLDPAATPEARLYRSSHRQAEIREWQNRWDAALQAQLAAAAPGDRAVYLDVGATYRVVPAAVAAWAQRCPRPSAL